MKARRSLRGRKTEKFYPGAGRGWHHKKRSYIADLCKTEYLRLEVSGYLRCSTRTVWLSHENSHGADLKDVTQIDITGDFV